ncbi:class I SAM-dependent methyltransferase [Amycolatopsis magusensis]|uniref:class I SAM-dependent methyltransferase n=1 Tax=Amycolatopsis magusensis TaxID=882444 RepID=UPI0024A9A355|nr:class I SAM-dependent methyltransferase [Amycolatopsis magusensis]MDI5978860.1 methyltransferase domain-containing protein [Amycolatopsis magusensis]
MSERWFRFLYRIGLTPWETSEPIAQLAELVQGTSGKPALRPGRALDLGCGTGSQVIYLAKRGWDAVGVDTVPRAIELARGKAKLAEVTPRWILGDVTEMDSSATGGCFTLLFDRGCLHSIPPAARSDYVTAVTRLAAPGAILLIIACHPSRGPWPKPAGLRHDEVTTRFTPLWTVEDHREIENGHVSCHWLRRQPQPESR